MHPIRFALFIVSALCIGFGVGRLSVVTPQVTLNGGGILKNAHLLNVGPVHVRGSDILIEGNTIENSSLAPSFKFGE